MSEPPTTDLPQPSARLYLRLLLGPSAAMGPGKADFLAMVGEVGSIAGAGRALGMSYKKARSLVDELNATFCGPVVATSIGGRGYGGAVLTPLGTEVLARYREIERRAAKAVRADLDGLAGLVKVPDPVPAPSSDEAAFPDPARR